MGIPSLSLRRDAIPTHTWPLKSIPTPARLGCGESLCRIEPQAGTGGLVLIAARGSGQWGLLALLLSAVTINYIDRGSLSVAPLVSREFSLSPAQLGLLFSAFFWSYAVFQLVAGWLVDRYEVKWVYAAGFLLWSLATAATGLLTSLPACS